MPYNIKQLGEKSGVSIFFISDPTNVIVIFFSVKVAKLLNLPWLIQKLLLTLVQVLHKFTLTLLLVKFLVKLLIIQK